MRLDLAVALALEFVVLLNEEALLALFLPVGAEEEEEEHEEEQEDGEGDVEEGGLDGVFLPVGIDLGLECLDLGGLGLERFVLENQDVGVGAVYSRGCGDAFYTPEGAVLKNIEGGAYQVVAFGGVYEGGVNLAVGDCLEADFGGTVDTYYIGVYAVTGERIGGGYGHAVVVGVDDIDTGVGREEGIGLGVGVAVIPETGD